MFNPINATIPAALLLLSVDALPGPQGVTARLQVERAAARELRRENIATQFRADRYKLAIASWNEVGGWRSDRPRGDADSLAKDLKIPVAEDPAVVECERPRTSKPCGIVGEGSLITFGVPSMMGDSASIEVSVWFWTPPAMRINDRFPDRPGGAIHYLVVRERANVWRVSRVLRRTIR